MIIHKNEKPFDYGNVQMLALSLWACYHLVQATRTASLAVDLFFFFFLPLCFSFTPLLPLSLSLMCSESVDTQTGKRVERFLVNRCCVWDMTALSASCESEQCQVTTTVCLLLFHSQPHCAALLYLALLSSPRHCSAVIYFLPWRNL